MKLTDIEKLIQLIEEFRKMNPDMQAQTMLTLLYAAKLEGRPDGVSVKDIEKALLVSTASASRNVSNLTEEGIKKQGGLGLLETAEDPMFRVRKIVKLTPKGKRVLETLIGILEKE